MAWKYFIKKVAKFSFPQPSKIFPGINKETELNNTSQAGGDDPPSFLCVQYICTMALENTRIANTFNKWKLFFVDSIHLSRKIMLAFLLSGNIHKSIWADMDTITNIGSYLRMTSNQVCSITLKFIVFQWYPLAF